MNENENSKKRTEDMFKEPKEPEAGGKSGISGEQQNGRKENGEKQRELQNVNEENCWGWMCSIPGLYLNHHRLLIRYFGTPQNVWDASGEDFEALRRCGYRWIGRLEEFRRKWEPDDLMHTLRQKGIQFISRFHPQFPEKLRHLEDSPYGLFYKGRLPDRDSKKIAVVGARMCSRYGKDAAQAIARAIAGCGGELISGAAYGIDGISQMEALRCGGRSYGILGCGADVTYPSGNHLLYSRLEAGGGILSEFPPQTPPARYHFPLRNRLISGLADVLVVVEARKKSGSLITADYAAEQGKEVFAVPGRLGDPLSEGCNELISQGAGIILSVEQFCENVFGTAGYEKTVKSAFQTLAPSEDLVYSSLGLHSKSLSELQECTRLSLDELSMALLSLEEKGLSRETDRNYYVRLK